MKYIKKTLTVALCLLFAMGVIMSSGYSIQKAYAADYKYTIKVYSGKAGYFNGDTNKHEVSITAGYGDQVTIDILQTGEVTVVSKAPDGTESTSKEDIKLTLYDNKTYYVRGVKISGHDNAEVGTSTDPPSFKVDGDVSYTAVYGMKGGMVKYIVNYVDENGAALAPSGEYYGMVDDKPVVSFKHIEGYIPNAYNLGKTLTANEAENVFTFTYSENEGETTTVVVNGGGAGGAGGAAGGAGGAGVNIADGNTPAAGPADYVDLDDNQTPTTDGTGVDGSTDIDDNKTPGVNWPLIGGGAVVLLGIAIAALAFARRRKSEEE